jgi:hypothetical protein
MTWDPNYKWANPTANWQKTYQSSNWYQPQQQMQQMPQQQMPNQQMSQQQMPQQQMPQQFYPRLSQQQLSSFMNFMQNKPLTSFMSDPRYQPVGSANSLVNPSTSTWNPGQFTPGDEQNTAEKALSVMLNLFR